MEGTKEMRRALSDAPAKSAMSAGRKIETATEKWRRSASAPVSDALDNSRSGAILALDFLAQLHKGEYLPPRVKLSGFRFKGLGFRAWALGFRLWALA
jgi:hypothetical protein